MMLLRILKYTGFQTKKILRGDSTLNTAGSWKSGWEMLVKRSSKETNVKKTVPLQLKRQSGLSITHKTGSSSQKLAKSEFWCIGTADFDPSVSLTGKN